MRQAKRGRRGCGGVVNLRRTPVGTGVTVPEGIGEVRNDFLLRNNVFITLGQYIAGVRGYWEIVTQSISSPRTRMEVIGATHGCGHRWIGSLQIPS